MKSEELKDLAIVIGGGFLLFKLFPAIDKIAQIPVDLLKKVEEVRTGGVTEENQQFLKDRYERFKDLIIAVVASIDQAKLKFTRDVYKRVAEGLYNAMYGAGTDEEMVFHYLDGLNSDELKTVYMDFGLRATQADLLGYWRKDLIQWFIDELSGNDLTRMKTIWQPTKLM